MLLVRYLEAEPGVYLAAAILLGLVVGSFLNVVIHRLPRMMEREWRRECREILGETETEAAAPEERYDLMVPRSRCPQCGHAISALENVPIVSYALLRGRCRACGWRIPVRYPVVEILGGVVAGVAAWHFGVSAAAGGAMLLGWALLAAAVIDFDTQLLPDAITLPFLWLGLAFNLGGVYASTQESLLGAMFGYGSLWGVYHLFRIVTGKEGMGYGDFKLLAMLGAWLGWQSLPIIVILSSLVGAVVGVGLIVLGGRGREVPMPFGPFLAAAGWLALYFGDALMSAWLGTLSPSA